MALFTYGWPSVGTSQGINGVASQLVDGPHPTYGWPPPNLLMDPLEQISRKNDQFHVGVSLLRFFSSLLQYFCQLFYSNFDNFRVRGHTRHLSMVDDSHPSYGTFVNGVKTVQDLKAAQYSCQRVVEGHGHTRKLSMICYSRVMKLSTLFSKLFYG